MLDATPSENSKIEQFDVVVIGGGPAGATAAHDLARRGRKVLLLDKRGRIKPCGGAIPPRLIRDFDIPPHLLKARVSLARMISPSDKIVDMPINGGFVGMVDRDEFDEWLRERAASAGATRIDGMFHHIERDGEPGVIVRFTPKGDAESSACVRARVVIGADGALSAVGRQEVPGSDKMKFVFAYHEIIKAPDDDPELAARCEIYYQGRLSPDFYAWIFPHGETMSVGVGSANKGFSLRKSVRQLRRITKLDNAPSIRHEGAPIPLKPLKVWDNGRDVLLAGDAAGVVAPSSGEGIYYAMFGGRISADAVEEFLQTGRAAALRTARKRFMKSHGRVFWILGVMQYFWYRNDARRERFVKICQDPDVQRLTWESYMNKELVRRDFKAHMRIFFKDLAHLFKLASP